MTIACAFSFVLVLPPAPAAPQAPSTDELAAVGPAAGPVAALSAPRIEAIEVVLSNAQSRNGIPGLSVAVAREGALVFAGGYGFADLENFVSARADTAYRLASVAKPITAALALRLADEGTLDLDGPVREHCPDFPDKRWALTPRQLLSHRGGVRHYRDGELPMTRRYTSHREGLELFKDDPLEFEPGTEYLYTTYGYNLLGCVIEGVTGRRFHEALHEWVFEPAGMNRSQPEDVLTLIPNRARGYIRVGSGRLANAPLSDVSYKVPGGGLSSTAPDVARFGLALVSGRLLTPESLEAMLTPAGPNGGPAGYGLGMKVDVRNGRREAWHTGGQTGVSTLMYLRPDDGIVVTLLANLQGLGGETRLRLARKIADLLVAPAADTE